MFKKSSKKNSIIIFWIIIAITVLFSGCSNSAYVIRYNKPKQKVKRYIVFPFKFISNSFAGIKQEELSETIHNNAEKLLLNHFISNTNERYDVELIPAKTTPPFPEFITQKETLKNNEAFIQNGQKVNAEGIIMGRIFRYRERIGGSFSIQRPASIAFDILIFDATTGHLIWKAQYDETQQSLSENLFRIGTFLKRKGRWVTAEEMMISGLKDVLKHFPKP